MRGVVATVGNGACSLGLADSQAGHINLALADAMRIAGETARAVSAWRETVCEIGAPAASIDRMSSAFKHDDLHYGLTLA